MPLSDENIEDSGQVHRDRAVTRAVTVSQPRVTLGLMHKIWRCLLQSKNCTVGDCKLPRSFKLKLAKSVCQSVYTAVVPGASLPTNQSETPSALRHRV